MIEKITKKELEDLHKIHPEVDFNWKVIQEPNNRFYDRGEYYIIDAMCAVPIERDNEIYYGVIRKTYSSNRSTLKGIKGFCENFEKEVNRMKDKAIIHKESDNIIFYQIEDGE